MRRAGLLTLVVAAGLLCGFELFLRSRGLVPSLRDDADAWALARAAVPANDPHAVVLVGASRMQQAIDLGAFAEELGGRRPVQLSVLGQSGLPVLRNLADDPTFRGIVLVDARSWFLVEPGSSSSREIERWLQHYDERSMLGSFEQRLRALLDGSLVMRRTDFSPDQVFVAWSLTGRLPEEGYATMLADRSVRADYSKMPVAELRRRFERGAEYDAPCADSARFGRHLDELRQMVARIESRGGRVVLVAMPVSGGVREVMDRTMSRERYWKPLVERSGALAIHFEDFPSLRSFRLPDDSHLDHRDSAAFSRALAAAVKDQLHWAKM